MNVESSGQIEKLERAIFWAGTNKVTWGKFKVNWQGLEIIYMAKFLWALRLLWP
jgi:hypothetical protein